MPGQITHRRDPETGNYIQVVTPERLREILDADGEDHSRPSGFGAKDQWEVADAYPPQDCGRQYQCGCGRMLGEGCTWTGPLAEMVVVEWMPKSIRASHEAARNRGIYPHNGSVRVAVSRACAEMVVEDDPEWAKIISADPETYVEEVGE